MSVSIRGLNHMGLIVEDMQAARAWFVEALNLPIFEDRGELLFLWVGSDILAVKTPRMAISKPEHGDEKNRGEHLARDGFQALDHYGFYASTPEEVDRFAEHATRHGATILKGPYDRSDGRSVYFKDPCGLVGEFLYFRPATEG